MNTASEVLIIIVSTVLTIFLIVLIIGVIYGLKVLKQIRQITEQAQSVVGSMEAAASSVSRAASPLAVLKLIGSIVDQTNKHRNKKG